MAHDVVDIGAHRGEQVDALEVGRSAGEADVERIAVDHQRGLAEAELAELRLKAFRLRLGDVEIVDDNQLAALPEALGALTSLRWLALDGNALTDLPAAIGRLGLR